MTTQTRVFSVDIVENVLIVTPNGDATGFRYQDIHTSTNSLVETIKKQKIDRMVVDFGEVEIVGSIIISSIIKLARSIADQKGNAAFCNSSETMRDVISTMNLTRLWDHYDSRREAIAAVAGMN